MIKKNLSELISENTGKLTATAFTILTTITIIIITILISNFANAQSPQYETSRFEDNTIYMTKDQISQYYIYPNNPADNELELEIEFTNGGQLIKNQRSLKKISVPPNIMDHSFPVEVVIDVPKSGYIGNLFFVEYIVYEGLNGNRKRYGPRGMFKVELLQSNTPPPSWDTVALRVSSLTLLLIILLVTTIMMTKKYIKPPKKKE